MRKNLGNYISNLYLITFIFQMHFNLFTFCISIFVLYSWFYLNMFTISSLHCISTPITLNKATIISKLYYCYFCSCSLLDTLIFFHRQPKKCLNRFCFKCHVVNSAKMAANKASQTYTCMMNLPSRSGVISLLLEFEFPCDSDQQNVVEVTLSVLGLHFLCLHSFSQSTVTMERSAQCKQPSQEKSHIEEYLWRISNRCERKRWQG